MSNVKQLEMTMAQYEQLAAQLKTAIDAVVAAVPPIELGPNETKTFVDAHQGVPPDFVLAVADSADPNELGPGVFDADEAKAVLRLREAFGSAVTEGRRLAAVVHFALRAHYARVARAALTAYAVTQRKARSGDPAMTLKAQTLKRALGRKRPPAQPQVSPSTPTEHKPQSS